MNIINVRRLASLISEYKDLSSIFIDENNDIVSEEALSGYNFVDADVDHVLIGIHVGETYGIDRNKIYVFHRDREELFKTIEQYGYDHNLGLSGVDIIKIKLGFDWERKIVVFVENKEERLKK